MDEGIGGLARGNMTKGPNGAPRPFLNRPSSGRDQARHSPGGPSAHLMIGVGWDQSAEGRSRYYPSPALLAGMRASLNQRTAPPLDVTCISDRSSHQKLYSKPPVQITPGSNPELRSGNSAFATICMPRCVRNLNPVAMAR
jgi:hypothetical protein